jgi:hypothetical protein
MIERRLFHKRLTGQMRHDPVARLQHVENAGEYIAFVRFPWLVANQAWQAIRENDKQHHQRWWNVYRGRRACVCAVHGDVRADKTVKSAWKSRRYTL